MRPLLSRGAPAEPLDLSLGEREADRETETPGPRAEGPKSRFSLRSFVLALMEGCLGVLLGLREL